MSTNHEDRPKFRLGYLHLFILDKFIKNDRLKRQFLVYDSTHLDTYHISRRSFLLPPSCLLDPTSWLLRHDTNTDTRVNTISQSKKRINTTPRRTRLVSSRADEIF